MKLHSFGRSILRPKGTFVLKVFLSDLWEVKGPIISFLLSWRASGGGSGVAKDLENFFWKNFFLFLILKNRHV